MPPPAATALLLTPGALAARMAGAARPAARQLRPASSYIGAELLQFLLETSGRPGLEKLAVGGVQDRHVAQEFCSFAHGDHLA